MLKKLINKKMYTEKRKSKIHLYCLQMVAIRSKTHSEICSVYQECRGSDVYV